MSAQHQDARAAAARPNVMAFASPTTTRFVVLLISLVTAGLFLGTWLHNQSPAGRDWTHRVAACTTGDVLSSSPGSLAGVAEFRRCTAGVERRRAGYALGGAAGALLAGVGVMCAAPYVIERRRRLRRAGPRLAPAAQRLATLAAAAHVRVPVLTVGPSTLRDAFSYGLPGRYRVALPPAVAVRWRQSALFDPLIRHELAHLARNDVAFAWLARSIWIVIVPLLAVPVVWGPLTGDLSLLPSYAWRAALLAVVTLLAANALLRTREHEADLRAAGDEETTAQLRGLLGRIPATPRTGWRRAVARHPSGAQRLAVLDQPVRLVPVSFVDGLTTAFLAALILPLLVALVVTRSGTLSFVLPAALIGPVFGATIGLGLWRQALAGRICGGRVRLAPAVSGVFTGSVLGEAASLAQAGTTLTGYDRLATVILGALVLAGATVVSAGLGELFADAAARLRTGRVAWIACVLLVGAVFAVAVWAGRMLAFSFDQAGWTLVGSVLVTILSTWPAAVLALALAAVSAWALAAARVDAAPPRWAVAAGGSGAVPGRGRVGPLAALAVGMAAGAVGALALVGFRFLSGPAGSSGEQEQRFYTYLWLFALSGVAAAVVLGLRMGARGLGVALLASPVASIVAAAGFLALNTGLGGTLTVAFATAAIRPALALGLLLLLAVAAVALLPGSPPRAPHPALAAAAAALLCGVLVCGVLASRNVVVPLAQFDRWVQPGPSAPAPTVPAGPSAEALAYTTSYVPDVSRVMDVVESSVAAIDQATLTDQQRAQRIRLECLTPVRTLLDDARTFQPRTAAVQAAHQHLLLSLRYAAQAFEHFALAYENADAASYQRATIERSQAKLQWQAWQQATALVAAGKTPAPAARNAYGQQTCRLFAQLVQGADTLDSAQLSALVSRMADSVARSGEPPLMQAVADLGQGALGAQPQRFATGMRTLSVLCDVPYK